MPTGSHSNGEGCEPRVFAARPRLKLALRLIVLAGIFALTAAVFWVASRSAPLQPAQPQSPAIVPAGAPVEKVPQTLPPVPAPASARPQPPGPFCVEADKEKYEILASATEVSLGTRGLGMMNVTLDGSLRYLIDGAPLPGAMCLAARIKSLITDAGATIVPELPEEFYQTFNTNEGSINTFGMIATVPDNAEWLREVEGVITVFFPQKWETLTWENPAAACGQTRKGGGMEFTLLHYKQNASGGQINVLSRLPLEDDRIRNRMMGYNLCAAGRVLVAFGCDHTDDWKQDFRLEGEAPTVFEVRWPVEIKREEITFRLKNVVLPVLPPAAATAASPEAGPKPTAITKCEAGGFRFQLCQMVLSSGERACLAIRINASRLPGSTAQYYNPWPVETKAEQEKGGALESMPQQAGYQMHELSQAGSCEVWTDFSPPQKDATRLVTFSAKLPVFMAEEKHTVEFPMPATREDSGGPLLKGSVTLESLRYDGDEVLVKGTIPPGTLAGAEECPFLCPIEFEMLDSDGKPMRWKERDWGNKWDKSSFYFKLGYWLQDRKPATFRIRYFSKGHFELIPFEFRDVELPRKAGKIEFPKLDF